MGFQHIYINMRNTPNSYIQYRNQQLDNEDKTEIVKATKKLMKNLLYKMMIMFIGVMIFTTLILSHHLFFI